MSSVAVPTAMTLALRPPASRTAASAMPVLVPRISLHAASQQAPSILHHMAPALADATVPLTAQPAPSHALATITELCPWHGEAESCRRAGCCAGVPPHYLVGDTLTAVAALTVAATGAPAPGVLITYTDGASPRSLRMVCMVAHAQRASAAFALCASPAAR